MPTLVKEVSTCRLDYQTTVEQFSSGVPSDGIDSYELYLVSNVTGERVRLGSNTELFPADFDPTKTYTVKVYED